MTDLLNSRLKPAAVLAGLAITLAACGGSTAATSTQGAPADAQEQASALGAPSIERLAYSDSILASAVEAQNEITTGSFTVTIDTNSDDFSGLMLASGSFDAGTNAVQMEIDISGLEMPSLSDDGDGLGIDFGAVFEQPMTFITIGEDSYLTGGFGALLGATDGAWLNLSPSVAELMSDGMPTNYGSPKDMFEEFSEADVTVTELGSAEYDGVTTTEYEITSDNPEVDSMKVWIGEDNLIRHFETTQIESGADGQSYEATVVGDVFGYGDPVSIEAPPADSVIEVPSFGG